MKQEDKKLLLKDILARLPYGVKCNALLKQIDGSLKSTFGTFKGYNNGYATVGQNLVDIETVKPYLRPMASMTDEETETLWNIWENDAASEAASKMTDFLNKKHLDHHHLTDKGLALEAPDGMYN